MATLDLTGHVYGRLTVTAFSHRAGSQSIWKCRCACGSERDVRLGNLRSGHTTSCGCAMREFSASLNRRHGAARGRTTSPELNSYNSAKQRCTNPRAAKWESYGGRGITMCEAWINDASAFLAYMGPKPSPAHTLDRIDNDGNYEPGNVRWATKGQQNANQRKRRPKKAA